MQVRQLRRAKVARTLAAVQRFAEMQAESERLHAEAHYLMYPDDDDYYDYDDDEGCTRCGGEGFSEVDDPMWDDCDEFGWGPCNASGRVKIQPNTVSP